MHKPPNRKARVATPGPDNTIQQSNNASLQRNRPSAQALSIVAEIAKSHCSLLRISIGDWRGRRHLELRECTATIPGIFWPTSSGLTIDIELLPQLVAAIVAAERECIERGLLPGTGGSA
jgi:hypothetical protein